jgi:transcriptional regulator with XRE-family HTH domain
VIRHVRTSSHHGVAEFAETVNVTPQYLWEIETGRPNLYITRLFRILQRLKITVNLTFGEPNEEPEETVGG